MAEISSSIIGALGAGSGVNMAELATQLATAQFQLRSNRLASRSEVLERQISAASSIKNTLSMLASALGERVRAGDLSSRPSVGSAAVATASSPFGTTGKGSYSLEVLALASSQTLASKPFASATEPTGGGTLTIRFGQTTASSFTEDVAQSALSLDIPADSTLEDVASAINAKSAGVTAYVAQTTSGPQLVMKGAEGAKSGFTVEVTGTSGAGLLSNLAWQVNNPAEAGQLLAGAQNASFKLDGLAMSSPTNQTGQVAPGLALNLTGTNAGAPTTVKFTDAAANISVAMSDLVAALNEVAGDLRNATNPQTGDLAADPGARALKNTFSQLAGTIIMPGAVGDAPRTLADLGVATERDGSFRLDTARLQATLARDPAGAAAMFTAGINGVFATIDKIARNAASTGDPGSLAGSIARYQSQSRDIGEDQTKLTEQQEALRATLVSRFAKADTRISASQSTLSFLKAQVDAWNSSRD